MRLLLIAAAATLVAAPAAAQSWSGYNAGHRSGWDVQSQYDRPGDYRCDAFWDANRDDCGARWRDQRSHTSWNTGYGHQGSGYGYGSRRGYGHDGGAAYYGAYGRPDVVYGGGRGRGGHGGYGQGARDPRRIDWCRASYRSYDPSSGYYRAYSGHLVWCG